MGYMKLCGVGDTGLTFEVTARMEKAVEKGFKNTVSTQVIQLID